MELLSPAGNREALEAAIACGADAVYLGYTAFGARSYAGNFDADQLRDAVEYAHERGRRVYVTVNTLVKDGELDGLCDVFELLCRVHADAALVQDMGAVRLARARFPELALHASTQMTVCNAQGARLLGSLGFTRVVPARECDLAELRRIADTGVEVEAFAHGALCVAVSGQCLFSSMIGGRSGNRGRCAQPCRLPYEADCGARGYLLSTKDLMTLPRLAGLRDAGVCSLKLEGRMKRPEYVGVVTAAYREALDALEAGEAYAPSRQTLDGLLQIFHRGGFTEGYVMGKSHAALMSWERPGHQGVRVGTVRAVRGNLARARMERALHDGDGLQVRGAQEAEFVYAGPDVPEGGEAVLRVSPEGRQAGVRPGDGVWRLTDEAQMRRIRARVAQGAARIPLAAELTAVPGERPALTLRDPDGHTVRVEGAQAVQRAQSQPLTPEAARRQLEKTGGTPYALSSLVLHADGAFLTSGALNALRRDALSAMRAARLAVDRPARAGVCAPCEWTERPPMLLVQGESLSEAAALLASGADAFVWQPQSYRTDDLLRALEEHPAQRPALFLPAALFTRELDALYALVCAHRERFSAVVANNLGALALDWPVPVWGGQGLNVMNAECARFFGALGVERLTASCELSGGELRALAACGAPLEIEAYGRTQLMLLSHCPRRTLAGDTARDARCDACAKDGGCPAVYTDRKGYRFPARRTRTDGGCTVRLYNSLPTDLARYAQRLRALGCSLRLAFTDEPLARREQLTRSYRAVLDGGAPLHEVGETTSGRFAHPVE